MRLAAATFFAEITVLFLLEIHYKSSCKLLGSNEKYTQNVLTDVISDSNINIICIHEVKFKVKKHYCKMKRICIFYSTPTQCLIDIRILKLIILIDKLKGIQKFNKMFYF